MSYNELIGGLVYVCGYCGEPVEDDYVPPNGAEQAKINGRKAHNECALRSALGGIGHLTNHAHWCIDEGDPDAGLSYRESSELVMAWVREHGMAAAVDVSSEGEADIRRRLDE